jgi:hypothetical protein
MLPPAILGRPTAARDSGGQAGAFFQRRGVEHMKNLLVCACVFGLGIGVSAGWAADDEVGKKSPTTSPSFDALKGLVGEWTGTGPDGDAMTTKFRLSAGGSVLVETLFPETPKEMVTVYHMDGPDLVLTHYCMLGNQPKLKADSPKETKKVSFKSVGGTNMKLTDPHMGRAVLTLVDNNHFEADWCSCSGGEPDESHRVNMKFTRKK